MRYYANSRTRGGGFLNKHTREPKSINGEFHFCMRAAKGW